MWIWPGHDDHKQTDASDRHAWAHLIRDWKSGPFGVTFKSHVGQTFSAKACASLVDRASFVIHASLAKCVLIHASQNMSQLVIGAFICSIAVQCTKYWHKWGHCQCKMRFW